MGLIRGGAIGALIAAAPLAAQSTNTVAPPRPVTPTPTPTPDTSVGPPQLRDFSLPGTVTRAAPPPPTPAPTAAEPSTTGPAPRSRPATTVEGTRPRREAPARRRETLAPAEVAPTPPTPAADAAPDLSTAAPTAPLTPPEAASAQPVPTVAAPTNEGQGASTWPWLAALLAALLGGAFWWWRRQQDQVRYASVARDDADRLGAALVTEPKSSPPASPAASPRDLAPATQPEPPARPEGIVTSRLSALPQGIVTSRLSAEVPPPPRSAKTPPAPPADGIVAAGLRPRLTLELVPIDAEADAAQGAVLTVDIVVTNHGSAPARDVLVEARLINAGPLVDAELAQFFARQAGPGERVEVIPPMARMSFRTQLSAAQNQLAPLVVEGRRLLVPMVAINAFYRGGAAEIRGSSSFLIGRGAAAGGKLAPFRLDLGPRRWTDLSVRTHSEGLAA